MSAFGLFTGTISNLERALNLRSLKHRVISSNIANIDTPNYKAFELVMEETLSKDRPFPQTLELERTNERHLKPQRAGSDTVRLKHADEPEFSLRSDGNTVDMDKSLKQMAENTIIYKAAAQIIAKKFQGLKNVIQGGNQ